MLKKALVTGASRGIGADIARALKADGWDIIINYRSSQPQAHSLASELGARAICADVSDMAQVRAMFDSAGPVELLVNNAGVAHYGLFTDTSHELWRKIFSVNVDGVYNCCMCALPGMIAARRGCIVNISSIWGVAGASCEAAYSASKAAVIGLSKSLAKELGPSSVRVNCVTPGVIETDMLLGFSRDDKRALADQTPLCRLGTPEDVAGLVTFLASDSARFITGQVIGVDGGFGI